jgi:hypothetical protein
VCFAIAMAVDGVKTKKKQEKRKFDMQLFIHSLKIKMM